MRTYQVTLEGKTPLLMHHDNIEWADEMERWKKDPRSRAGSKPGDDRSPAFRWLGCLYHDRQQLVIPSDNVMSSLMSGGALVPTGKGQKTFKAQTQSGILSPDLYWPLLVKGQTIPVAPFLGSRDKTFDEYQELATANGFMLYVKRVPIGQSKHIRVRPRFDGWSVAGTLVVTDEAITKDVLEQIGTLAGQRAGLGDWRPSAKHPGPHGMFEIRVTPA